MAFKFHIGKNIEGRKLGYLVLNVCMLKQRKAVVQQ